MALDFNYSRAISQASQMEDIAREMRSLVTNKLDKTYASINAAWDGECSDSYMSHCWDTSSRLTAKANELDSIASRLRTAARIIKEAEERARRLKARKAAAAP